MNYRPTKPEKKSKPRVLAFVLLPLIFGVALFALSRPVQSTAQTEPAAPVDNADTVVRSNVVVVEDRARLAITVTNQGPGDEPRLVSVINTFPEGTSYASSSGKDWDCEYNEETRTAECAFGSTLVAGDSTELVLLADREPGARDSYLNTTTAIGTLNDPTIDNNSVVTELFNLGQDVQGGVEIGSDAAEVAASKPNSNDAASFDDEDATSRQTDDDATAATNKPAPILPKTGTNLTALLLGIGVSMALGGYRLVYRSEQSKMLAFALSSAETAKR